MSKSRKLTTMAMLAALSYLIVFICHFVMPPLVEMPPLKLDLKDVMIVMGGFIMGPMAACLISVTVSLIEMVTISSTGIFGCIMNILSSCAFACTAAAIYKKVHTKKGATISLVAGTVAMVIVMLLWNYILTPIYNGWPRDAVTPLLIPVFLPFNALKGGINTALTLLLYKPIVTALRKSGLVPREETGEKKAMHISVEIYVLGGVLLMSCVLFALSMAGVI